MQDSTEIAVSFCRKKNELCPALSVLYNMGAECIVGKVTLTFFCKRERDVAV